MSEEKNPYQAPREEGQPIGQNAFVVRIPATVLALGGAALGGVLSVVALLVYKIPAGIDVALVMSGVIAGGITGAILASRMNGST